MSDIIKDPRGGCALHGALQTVQNIRGAVPVVHANPGCGVINQLAARSGISGTSQYSYLSIPGTDAQERHVIFGGASRLREQIKNTIKVTAGDLYVILNSCESAMVGDDVDAMTREIVEQGEPVVDTLVAGFNGGFHYGYEHVLADIFKSIDGVKKSDEKKDGGLVNIFGIVPGKDIYWQGNLDEIERILGGLGLRANVFFGANGGADDLANAKNAAASLVFSRWGELPAKVLEDKYKIPIISIPSLPQSAVDVSRLAAAIGDVVEIDAKKAEAFVNEEREYEKYFLLRARDEIYENGLIRDAVIIADEEQAIRIGLLLHETLGTQVNALILTDSLKKDEDHVTNNEALLKGISGNIYKTSDEKEIEDIIRSKKAEVIFGSSLERKISKQLHIPLAEVSYPAFDRLILNEPSAGVRGEVRFIEEYVSIVKKHNSKVRKELYAFVKGEKKLA